MTETLYHLNKLGPLYHSYFGLHPEDDNRTDIFHYSYSTNNKQKLEQLIKYFNEGQTILNRNSNHITLISDIKLNKKYDIKFNYDEIIEESKIIVPYSEVIIKYTQNNWYGELREWYNQPSTRWRSFTPFLRPYVLPYLNTRDYITIIEPFMEVRISKERISIDDILFATRALMLDDRRIINDGYSILNETPEVLTLEPHMDNFSS